jgi:hypothetical protein
MPVMTNVIARARTLVSTARPRHRRDWEGPAGRRLHPACHRVLPDNDIEIVVLRHQLTVLKRQVGRPRLRRRDWLFMAALSQILPRPRWSSFVVRPQTLLGGRLLLTGK